LGWAGGGLAIGADWLSGRHADAPVTPRWQRGARRRAGTAPEVVVPPTRFAAW